jgi:hypothetical protein
MPRYEDDEAREAAWDDEELDDPEGPQECDLAADADDEDDETPTVPCPHCRREIPDFADRCPYCGDWVVQRAGDGRRSLWFVAALVAAALVLLFFFVL